jgi:hypothetical protein
MISQEFEPHEPFSQGKDSFVPPRDNSDRRTAKASEYTAGQLFEMNKKLDRLIEAIDRLAAKL